MNKRLKELRLKNGMSQKEMALFLNMPYRTYQNYEEGSTEIMSWVLSLIEYRFSTLDAYSFDKGIYSIKQLKYITKNIFKRYRIASCYLYGEYLDNPRENSYISLLINSRLDTINIASLHKDLELALNKRIDLIELRALDHKGEFAQNILKKGVVIYRSYHIY